MVSQLAFDSERFHSLRIAGTTADALNHSDIPSSSAIDNSVSAVQRALGAIGLSGVEFVTKGWTHLDAVVCRMLLCRSNLQEITNFACSDVATAPAFHKSRLRRF